MDVAKEILVEVIDPDGDSRAVGIGRDMGTGWVEVREADGRVDEWPADWIDWSPEMVGA